MYKIMVIEDDMEMADAMKKQIETWGNEVTCVKDFQDIMPEFIRVDPHMVLVDIMLPFYNGYYWCTQIRKISDVPVIFLSSASDKMNIVMCIRDRIYCGIIAKKEECVGKAGEHQKWRKNKKTVFCWHISVSIAIWHVCLAFMYVFLPLCFICIMWRQKRYYMPHYCACC